MNDHSDELDTLLVQRTLCPKSFDDIQRRNDGINQHLYHRWSKELPEAGKKCLAGDTAREASADEVKSLRHRLSRTGVLVVLFVHSKREAFKDRIHLFINLRIPMIRLVRMYIRKANCHRLNTRVYTQQLQVFHNHQPPFARFV